jgi:hypothetical protein
MCHPLNDTESRAFPPVDVLRDDLPTETQFASEIALRPAMSIQCFTNLPAELLAKDHSAPSAFAQKKHAEPADDVRQLGVQLLLSFGSAEPFEWTGAGSNRRHQDFQSCALPAELPVHPRDQAMPGRGERERIHILQGASIGRGTSVSPPDAERGAEVRS